MQIATFDFHNTVAYCDPWFELEIRDLPARVLVALAPGTGIPATEAERSEATDRYRALRMGIMASGVEIDAQEAVERVFTEMGLPVNRPAIAQVINDLMRDTLTDLEPVPGSVETITTIMNAGTPVGIISSAVYHPFLEWSLKQFGLLDRLSFVATSASVGFYKSDVRIYHLAYKAVNATVGLGVHVGDSPKWDVDIAKQAGLGTVLYAETPEKRTSIGSNGMATPDVVLDTLVDADRPILDLLEKRRNGQEDR